MNGEENHGVHVNDLTSEDESQKKSESENPKESKPPSPTTLHATLVFPTTIFEGQT